MQENQPESTNRDLDAPQDLDDSQILAIMDMLNLMEATWHKGGAIAQTVYTCHYLLHQDRYGPQAALKTAYGSKSLSAQCLTQSDHKVICLSSQGCGNVELLEQL